MATINTGSHPQQLWPGVKKIFGASYADKPLVCDMVFNVVSSDKSYEKYVEEAGFGLAPVKTEGDGVSYDTDSQGYTETLYNTTYALGAKITQEAIEDNQYFNVAQRKAKKLARSMRQTKETVGANILNRAFSSSYTGGDGLELCSTAHPTQDGTQSNEPSVATDFSEVALEDALTAIRGYKDVRGIRIQAKGMKLIVPSGLEFDATRVLSSANQSGTANNDINAMKERNMLPGGIVVWDYLTDANAWFVTTDVDDGLIHQQRIKMALRQDNDFDTTNACMAARERYAFGWGDWRGIWGSPGA